MIFLLKEIKNHPHGLVTLFFTELWERFSYYGMRAILVLYLISETEIQNTKGVRHYPHNGIAL